MILTMALKTRSQTRDVSSLAIRAEVGTVNKEKRTVDVMFSTGARVLRQSYWDGPSYEELSLDPTHVRMDRLSSGTAPFLTDHRSGVDNVVGVVESARLQGGKGHASIRFPAAGIDERADQLFAKVQDGIIRSVSVGYRTYKTEKVGVEGDAKTPVFRATDWEPHEISAVALPAEVGAGFRSDDKQCNPCVFVTREEENDVDEEAKKAAEAEEQAKVNRELEERAAKVERERISSIQAVCRKYGLAELETKLVSDKTPIDQARSLMMVEIEKREIADPSNMPSGAPGRIEVGETERQKRLRGMETAILYRTGVLSMLAAVAASVKAEPAKRAPGVRAVFKNFDADDDGGEFRSYTMADMAAELLESRGEKTRGMTREGLIKRALEYTRDNGSQQTSSDFSVALENVMYKTLLGAYAQQADTWRRWCGVDSVQDFRPSNRYRLGSFSVLDLIGESGEYKQKTIPDAVKQQISTQTYGNKVSLSRKAIVNDDMGAVVASADRFGRMAGLSLEVAAYALLAQNGGLGPTVTYNGITAALFDAQFANIGTGAAITADSLVADQVKMGSQKDISNNEFLDLRPNTLLVPLTLEASAKQINRATYDPTPGSAFEAPNKAAGLFRDIVGTPRLTGTRRYMFTDQTPALVMVFLNGSQVPVMEQRPGWDIDGIEWKLRMDFNAQGFDPKGAITNAGS